MSQTTARIRITRRSGKVHVVAAPGSALAVDGGTTVSGDISLGANRGGRLAARSSSGWVKITLPSGARPATRLKAVSGHVRNECEPGHDGEVRAASVSGAISVTCR